jgi:hypothetical protein
MLGFDTTPPLPWRNERTPIHLNRLPQKDRVKIEQGLLVSQGGTNGQVSKL